MRTRFITLAVLVVAVAGGIPRANAGWQFNGIPVGAPVNTQSAVAVVPNGNGAASVLFQEVSPGGSSLSGAGLTGFGALTWMQPVTAPTGTFYFPGPGTVASDGAGGEIAVWNTHASGNWDIIAQRTDIYGNRLWGPDGVFVCSAAGDQVNPLLIADGAGGAICVWEDKRSDPFGDIYVQRMNASGTMLWTNNGVAACANASAQSLGSLISDNAGGVVLAWDDSRNGNYDIYVQRINASGNVLWAASGNPFVTTPATEHFGQMVASGNDGAILTWVVPALGGTGGYPPPWPPGAGDNYNAYTRRLDFGGNPDWLGSVLVCIADGSRYPKALVSDGAGGAIIGLYDNRLTSTDVFLTRVDRLGNQPWGVSGVRLCTGAGDQVDPTMVPDGAGGAIVAWSDHRGGPAADIYAGHVDALGNAMWDPAGVAVCTAVNDQSRPNMMPDGVGGVVVAWEDSRGGGSRAYVQRLNGANGAWGNPNASGVGDTPARSALVARNYPNPFGAGTDLEIELPATANVSIDVYDVAGRRVNDLAPGRLPAGWTRIPFRGRDDSGRELASGVYFYRVTAGASTITRKMVIER